MKYLKIIIILIAISCNGQLKNRNNMEMEISDKIEYFKSSELLSKGKKTPIDNNGNFDYSNVEYNNTTVVYTFGQKDKYYISLTYKKNSFYATKKTYHGNTMIKEKGIFFNGNENTKLGVWYEFDSKGKVINKTNYDEGYNFSFEDILNYCKKNKINIELGDARKFEGGFHSQILKGKRDGVKVWIINYQDGIKQAYGNISKNGKNYEYSIYDEIILDGKTGKILSKKTVDFGNEQENKASFLADPNEKGSYKKPEIGIVYTEGNKIPEGTYQIYNGRAYTKAEWDEFYKTLSWLDRLFIGKS